MIARFYWLTAISFLLITPSNISSQASMTLLLPAGIQSNNSSNFIDFKGKAKKCAVQLEWSTSPTSKLRHFELEKANSGGTFKKIATITAKRNTGTNTHYSFEDYTVRLSTNFRIKAISLNGDHEYSEIINVLSSCGKKKVLVEAYSKPITQTIYIHAINNNELENCVVEIYQNFGQTVYRKPVSLQHGLNTVELSTVLFLPDTYFVQLIGDGWKSRPKRVTVD